MVPSALAGCTWAGTMSRCTAGDSRRCSGALRSTYTKLRNAKVRCQKSEDEARRQRAEDGSQREELATQKEIKGARRYRILTICGRTWQNRQIYNFHIDEGPRFLKIPAITIK